ncbi:hypothetical protein [Leifsonia sp. Leaf264]|uniref:hypothetical protein n=1 Tax=Leifsonia sp. Leaf264 TaxID=1736314 RepID=UPI0006FE330F|nr:hypothetical protein [Leifsonia sp. Leaf264]KQO98417.1 hypothetical protein ASF30_10170 [Leifsonia sp. Leaf264]
MDWTRAGLERAGFDGWVRFADLPDAGVPAGPGVYVIVRPTDAEPTFTPTSTSAWHKKRDPVVAVSRLEKNWVPGSQVLYIGKADIGTAGDRGLAQRLKEYRLHGTGKSGHHGGRFIWQLADAGELLVAWMETPGRPPRTVEKQLIADFKAQFGARPFANLTG